MKLSHRISIDLKIFILEGRFDYVELGQTKEHLRRHFADPDWDHDTGKHGSRWQFGTMEFHFTPEGRLWLIYTDYLPPDGGQALQMDNWVLTQNPAPTLAAMLELLNSEFVAYRVSHEGLMDVTHIDIERSGVRLSFENNSDAPLSVSERKMVSISLSRKELLDRSYSV